MKLVCCLTMKLLTVERERTIAHVCGVNHGSSRRRHEANFDIEQRQYESVSGLSVMKEYVAAPLPCFWANSLSG